MTGRERCRDRGNVTMIGATAPADDIQVLELRAHHPVAVSEVQGIAGVQLLRLVQLGMALDGRIRAEAPNAIAPHSRLVQYMVEVRWVRAVDHEVRGTSLGLGVYFFDRRPQ